MIEKIDIKDAGIAEEIRNNMAVATVTNKGLIDAGRYVMLSIGDSYFQKIVIELRSKSYAELIASVGSFEAPSLIGINMGMKGGPLAGLPHSLSLKTFAGTPCVSAAKAFHRNGKNYIQVELANRISWSGIGAFCILNTINAISIDGSLEYNSSTDTNLVNGTVE